MANQRNRHRIRLPKEEDYYAKSNALNMTIYDLYGNRLPKEFTKHLVDEVNKLAAENGFGFSHTMS